MDRPDKPIVFTMLIIALILVGIFLDVLWRELGRPVFLGGVFGLAQFNDLLHTMNWESSDEN